MTMNTEPATVYLARHPDADSIRLRATLRLLTDGPTADSLARDVPDLRSPGALKVVTGRLRIRLITRSITSRLTRERHAPEGDRPFADPRATPSRAATALCFHIGLDLPGEGLAGILGVDADQIGRDMLRARRLLDPAIPVPCRRYEVSIGRYRDRTLDAEDRLALLAHVTHCGECRAALEYSRRLDTDLAGEVERQASLAGGASPSPVGRPWFAHRVMAIIAPLAMVTLIVAATVAASRVLRSAHEPVPIADSGSSAYTGWLLRMTSDSSLVALNLASGQSRVIRPHHDGELWYPSASPRGTYTAFWRQPMIAGQWNALEIVALDGHATVRREWSTPNEYLYPSGWLDDATLLVVVNASFLQNETVEDYQRRAAESGRLLAIDARDGSERVLYRGNVQAAVSSPDGKMVALIAVWDYQWPGQTIEIRTVENAVLGAPVASVDHRSVGQMVWLPDSSGLVFGRIADTTLIPLPNSAATSRGPDPGFDRQDISVLQPNGKVRTLTDVPEGSIAYPVSVSPDGTTLVYGMDGPEAEPDWHLWHVPVAGGVPALLDDDAVLNWYGDLVWSPTGSALLMEIPVRPYLERDSPGSEVLDTSAVQTVVFGSDWSKTTLQTRFNSYGGRILAWLPEDALSQLSESTSPTFEGGAVDVGPLDGIDPDVRIEAWSAADRSGSRVALFDGALDIPVIWETESATARRLPSGIDDLSWGADDAALVGTVGSSGSNPTSRLMTYVSSLDPGMTTGGLGFIRYDPSALGDSTTSRYERPAVSPDGNATTFFISDSSDGRIELWLERIGHDPERVFEWSVPADRIPDLPLTAAWVNNETLLFSVPQDWDRGLPRRADLMRLRLDNAGTAAVDNVLSVNTSGRDRGVVLRELAVSPDAAHVAWRVRHFKERANDRGRIDTIHVVDVVDASRRLEIGRGNPGDGIAWSPDSGWVAAGLARRIALLSTDGLTLEYVTPEDRSASLPVWVGQNDLWFNVDEADGTHIWHARIR